MHCDSYESFSASTTVFPLTEITGFLAASNLAETSPIANLAISLVFLLVSNQSFPLHAQLMQILPRVPYLITYYFISRNQGLFSWMTIRDFNQYYQPQKSSKNPYD